MGVSREGSLKEDLHYPSTLSSTKGRQILITNGVQPPKKTAESFDNSKTQLVHDLPLTLRQHLKTMKVEFASYYTTVIITLEKSIPCLAFHVIKMSVKALCAAAHH